jgi:hypothetical protein
MDMGMIHQVLAPGVEDADKTDLSKTSAQFQERLFHCFKKDIIEYLLVS